jgi:hypothetical protein
MLTGRVVYVCLTQSQMKCEVGHERGLPILNKIPCNFTPRNGQRSISSMPLVLVIYYSLFSKPSIRYTHAFGNIPSLDYKFLSNIILSFPSQLISLRYRCFSSSMLVACNVCNSLGSCRCLCGCYKENSVPFCLARLNHWGHAVA